MASQSSQEIEVVLDEDRLRRRGFQIDDARARLVERSDDEEVEYEVRWSIRGRFDPQRWSERYQADFSPPALVPMLYLPSLGDRWICQYLSEFQDTSGRIRIGAKQELHGLGGRMTTEGVRAMVTAFDTAEVDFRPVPITKSASPVKASSDLESAACGCAVDVSVLHASTRYDDAQEESYLQTYVLGSIRHCGQSEEDGHELPAITLEIEDDSGFILESRQAVTLYGDDDVPAPEAPADWLFAMTMSLDELSETPAQVIVRSP